MNQDLPRKNNGIHATADQNTLLPNPASEFAEIPLPGRHAARSDPAAVLHIGTITVEFFEDTFCELLAKILKAVRSCQGISPMWRKFISAAAIPI